MELQRKKDELTVSNESVPKCTTIKAGSVIAINLVALPKGAGQLTPTKICIYECFPESNVIPMNGMILMK